MKIEISGREAGLFTLLIDALVGSNSDNGCVERYLPMKLAEKQSLPGIRTREYRRSLLAMRNRLNAVLFAWIELQEADEAVGAEYGYAPEEVKALRWQMGLCDPAVEDAPDQELMDMMKAVGGDDSKPFASVLPTLHNKGLRAAKARLAAMFSEGGE